MADTADLSDPDFTAQMQGLVEQAQQALGDGSATRHPEAQESAPTKEAQQRVAQPHQTLPQMLRPFVVALEAITRTTAENTQVLAKLEKSSCEAAAPLKQLPGAVSDLQVLLDRKDALSRQMFDALHEELRGYKDGFLLETVHRPLIRDLITLYDDLSEIRRQMQAALTADASGGGGEIFQRLKTIEVNLQHNLEFILGVLARLEVSQLPVGAGKLDKKTQRALAVEETDNPDDDLNIVRVLKCGFLWKERVVRPEEVIVKKWRDGSPVVLQSDQ